MRILHRYILNEMLKAFALALAGATGVVSFGLVLSALQSQGLSPLSSIFYMGLSLPAAIYLALSLAAVLATTLVYGRLSADNEIMAAQASGVPLSSLFWPTTILAILTAAASLVLAAYPLPESNSLAKRVSLRDAESLFYTTLSNGKKISLRQPNGEGFQLQVDRVVGDLLYGPTLKYRGKRGQTYIFAPYGKVRFLHEENKAEMTLWYAIVMDEAGASPIKGTHRVVMPLPTQIVPKEDELTLWELMFVQRHPEQSERYKALPETAPEEARAKAKKEIAVRAMAEMHTRLANALGCFGLVLVGTGLGVLLHSGHLLTAFGVALVPWITATLLTIPAAKTVARNFEHAHRLVPIIWLPNVAVCLLGLAIFLWLLWGWYVKSGWRTLSRRRRP